MPGKVPSPICSLSASVARTATPTATSRSARAERVDKSLSTEGVDKLHSLEEMVLLDALCIDAAERHLCGRVGDRVVSLS